MGNNINISESEGFSGSGYYCNSSEDGKYRKPDSNR